MGKAAKAAPEIDKPLTKKMFSKAKKKPVPCALATATQGGGGLIFMDKRRPGRAIMRGIVEAFGKKDITNIRFGTARIDKTIDPKLVTLDMNKPLQGAARKLKKALKGTGITKIRYVVAGKVEEELLEVEPGDENEPEIPDDDEDDTDEVEIIDDGDEGDIGEDEGDETEAREATEATEQDRERAQEQAHRRRSDMSEEPTTSEEETTSEDEGESQESGPDFAAMAERLTVLARWAVEVMKKDPERGGDIRKLLVQAQAAIKAQDPGASDIIDALELAVEDDEDAAADGQLATPEFDEAGLKARLTDAVKAMMAAVKADPSRGDALRALAQDATNGLKNRDPGTEEAIALLEDAISGGAPSTPASSGDTAPTASPAPEGVDPAKHAALTASPKLWVDTMSVIKGGIDQLKDAIRRDLGDEAPEVLADVEANLSKIDAVTSRFDKQLADILEAAAQATDAAQRANQLKEARKVLAAHIKDASTEPLIGMIDDNPFGVSPNIKNTLVTNLTQLAAAVR